MDALGNLIVGLAMLYIVLLIFPMVLKAVGFGFIANPLIRLINSVFLFPFRFALSSIRAGRQSASTSVGGGPPPSGTLPGASGQPDFGWGPHRGGVWVVPGVYRVRSGSRGSLSVDGPYDQAGGTMTTATPAPLHVRQLTGPPPLDGWYWVQADAYGAATLTLDEINPPHRRYHVLA